MQASISTSINKSRVAGHPLSAAQADEQANGHANCVVLFFAVKVNQSPRHHIISLMIFYPFVREAFRVPDDLQVVPRWHHVCNLHGGIHVDRRNVSTAFKFERGRE